MSSTSAPWSVGPRCASVYGPDGLRVAAIDGSSGRLAQRCGNAKLVAAAPLLLQACREAQEAIDNLLPQHRGQCLNPLREEECPCTCTPCVLRRAIAAATGEKP